MGLCRLNHHDPESEIMAEPTERQQAYWNRLRQARWNRRLAQMSTGSTSEPLPE